jgi:signal transduction histidine kinase
MPATRLERGTALGVIIFLSVVFALVLPFAHVQVGRVDAFIPVVQTVLCFAELITAVFLFAQYSIRPQLALLALASGYIFSGLFAFLQALDFPGAYSATGLISGDPSGPAWLFSFWHLSFPLAVIAYALLKDPDQTTKLPLILEPGRTIAVTVGCVLVVIAGLTWLVAARYLPAAFSDLRQITVFFQYLIGALWLLTAIALLLMLVYMRTILGLWLVVVLFTSLPDLTLPFLYPVVRYSLGWYVGRIFTLIASCTVLVVLLLESTMLYARLASAVLLQRRERAHGLMSVDEATSAIAHEIRQPLSAISASCSAAMNWLKGASPNLEEANASLAAAVKETVRADEIMKSVRGLFKATEHHRTPTDINRVAREVLSMVEHDLHNRGIYVSTEFQDNLSQIMADPVQLQQVTLNLVKNGIEAIDSGPRAFRSLRLITTQNRDSLVSLSVQDSGPGISPENATRIFEPFFTTKSSGMGLGLCISRRIIEDHGGQLRITKTDSHGSTFEITLPSA